MYIHADLQEATVFIKEVREEIGDRTFLLDIGEKGVHLYLLLLAIFLSDVQIRKNINNIEH